MSIFTNSLLECPRRQRRTTPASRQKLGPRSGPQRNLPVKHPPLNPPARVKGAVRDAYRRTASGLVKSAAGFRKTASGFWGVAWVCGVSGRVVWERVFWGAVTGASRVKFQAAGRMNLSARCSLTPFPPFPKFRIECVPVSNTSDLCMNRLVPMAGCPRV